MITFGRYEIVEELCSSAQAAVYRAKLVGGSDARFAIKVFNSSQTDPDEPHWEAQYFLDRARVQRHLVNNGAKYWAPVHDLGLQGFTAYAVTDFHPRSIQTLITDQTPISASFLHAMVLNIVRGLTELGQIASRSHGNLKPSNVLLVGREPETARVLLADPGPARHAAKDAEIGDLHAVGLLIHQLVLNRKFDGPVGESLPASSGWERLGPYAESWRQLCHDLMAHRIDGWPASLLGVARKLESLAPAHHTPLHVPTLKGPPLRKLRKPLITAAALAGLALAGGGILAGLSSSAQTQFCREKTDWFGPLATELSDPEHRLRFNDDPQLRTILTRLDKVDMSIKCDAKDSSLLSLSEYRRTRAALAAMQDVKEGFSSERWKRLSWAIDLQKRYQDRGWAQPAAYLSALIADARLSRGRKFADGLNRFLDVLPNIERSYASGEDNWKLLDERTAELRASPDESLRTLAGTLRASAAGAVQLSDRGFEGLNELASSATVAVKLVEEAQKTSAVAMAIEKPPLVPAPVLPAPKPPKPPVAPVPEPAKPSVTPAPKPASALPQPSPPAPPTIVQPPERTLPAPPQPAPVQPPAVQPTKPPVNPTPEPLKPPVEVAKQPLLLKPEQIALAVGTLRRQLADISDSIGKYPAEPARQTAFAKEKQALESEIDAFGEKRFTEADLNAGFASAQSDLNKKIDALAKTYAPETPQHWLASQPPLATSSQRVNDYWKSWTDSLAREMKGEPGVPIATRDATNGLLLQLSELDRTFPAVPSNLPESFATTARTEREQQLAKLLEALDPKRPTVDAAARKQVADAYGAWCRELADLGKDFPIAKPLLMLDDRPDEKWDKKANLLWKDPRIQAALKPDLQRIARLQSLADAPAANLLQVASEAKEPELVLTAWRLLPARNPAWPATSNDLKTEASLRQRLLDLLKPLKDSPERAAAISDLREQGAVRWMRFVSAAKSETMLRDAALQRNAFEVADDRLNALPPAARFNIWLYLARQASGGGADVAVKTIVTNLGKAAETIKGQEGLTQKLGSLDAKEPFAEQRPGDVFKLAFAPDQLPLEFRRVEPKAARPFYLCTTEMSFAQFTGVVSSASAWSEVRRLPWPYLPGAADSRRGARVWEWSDTASAAMSTPMLWLSPEDYNDYPPELRAGRFNRTSMSPQFGGDPSPDHPMQHVSPPTALYVANLLACRLPTSTEWMAAYAYQSRTIASMQPNLRDQTWELEQKYLLNNSIPREHWLDRGVFGASASTDGVEARSRPENDGTLLFRAVNVSDGLTFHNLIGNVAEFVCDAPRQYESWPQKQFAEGIQQFVKQNPDSLFVIGGSALSPVESPVIKPLPAGRSDMGYSDVGFRLAFTAPARSLAERLKWTLADQPYVWTQPAAVSTNSRSE